MPPNRPELGLTHELARNYLGAKEILAEIDTRAHDTRDHITDTQRLIDTYHPKRLRVQVDKVIIENHSTTTLRLTHHENALLPTFLAGQYVSLFIDGTSRPYAISSSPAQLDHYDLTIRRVPGGRISNVLLNTARKGQVFSISGPMGTFHHNPLFHGDDVIFLAGGSGVVPAMSMIREIADCHIDRRFHLIYGSRTLSDVIFYNELNAMAAAHSGTRVDHVIEKCDRSWSGAHGLLTSATIRSLTGGLNDRMVYVCGPQALYPYAMQQLSVLAHPTRRIRFEANGAPADPTRQARWPSEIDPIGNVTVTIDGVSFRTPRNRPLLTALEDHGIRPEAACRSGECGLCRVRVVSGDVYTADEARLRLADKKFGYIHSCVAYPLTDVELDISCT
jgi:ferredoxin-NADP reductase